MVKVIHAADFHLDSSFAALSPEKAKQRREEGRSLVQRLCALCEEEEAELLLLAGDLFDGRHVYPETVALLAEAFSGIRAKVFIAPGNHDFYTPGGVYDRVPWPENVHIFRSRSMETVELPELNTVVHGAAFTAPEFCERPLKNYTVPQDGRIHIVLLHGDTAAGDSPYAPITEEDIAACGAEYLALGHIHTPGGVLRAGSTAYAYPGVPEGRGFDETGEKGVLLGTVERAEVRLRFHPISLRRYEIVSADVTGKIVLKAAEEALAGLDKDIVRLILTGQRVKDIPLAYLRECLSERVFALQLQDETWPEEDIWARKGEDTLRGLFLREMEKKLSSASEEEKKTVTDALHFGLAALEGRDL